MENPLPLTMLENARPTILPYLTLEEGPTFSPEKMLRTLTNLECV